MATATKARKREKPAVRHLEGCPAGDERLESYPERLVKNGKPVTVTRCQECGAQSVDPRDEDEGDA
jgi:hypothetical protein